MRRRIERLQTPLSVAVAAVKSMRVASHYCLIWR